MNSNFWFYSSGHCQKPCLPILPICDLGAARRYLMLEKSLLKIIDFDSVVKNTKSSKSIILMPGFSTTKLRSHSSQATNMDYFIPWGLSLAGEGTELIMLGNLRMCQEVFAFWEIEVRRIDNWELFFRKENYFRWLLSQTILSIYRIEKNGNRERYNWKMKSKNK